MLYEQVDLKTLSQKEFSEVIYRADELIMKPFARYRKDFSDDIQEKTTMIPIALLRSLRLTRLLHARSSQRLTTLCRRFELLAIPVKNW